MDGAGGDMGKGSDGGPQGIIPAALDPDLSGSRASAAWTAAVPVGTDTSGHHQ
ncbi:hypothetical protein [Azospirillum palustre]